MTNVTSIPSALTKDYGVKKADFNNDNQTNKSINTLFDLVDANHDGNITAEERNQLAELVKKHSTKCGNGLLFTEQAARNVLKALGNKGNKLSAVDLLSFIDRLKVINYTKQKGAVQNNPTMEVVTPSVPDKGVPAEQAVKPENVIANALQQAGIDYVSESDEFKSHILRKYDMMMRMYGDNKPDDSIINQRLVNYAKGFKFHQFELLASQGAEVEDYQLGSNSNDKRAKYNEFGAQYVEVYDNNGDGKADIWEIFQQELIDHYMITERMDSKTAQANAINAVEKYSKMSFAEIDKSTDNSKEMQLLKAVMAKVASISEPLINESDWDNPAKSQELFENIQSISPEEAACLGLTYDNFMEVDAAISSAEYNNAERGIAGGEDGRRNRFIQYMQLSHGLLK